MKELGLFFSLLSELVVWIFLGTVLFYQIALRLGWSKEAIVLLTIGGSLSGLGISIFRMINIKKNYRP